MSKKVYTGFEGHWTHWSGQGATGGNPVPASIHAQVDFPQVIMDALFPTFIAFIMAQNASDYSTEVPLATTIGLLTTKANDDADEGVFIATDEARTGLTPTGVYRCKKSDGVVGETYVAIIINHDTPMKTFGFAATFFQKMTLVEDDTKELLVCTFGALAFSVHFPTANTGLAFIRNISEVGNTNFVLGSPGGPLAKWPLNRNLTRAGFNTKWVPVYVRITANRAIFSFFGREGIYDTNVAGDPQINLNHTDGLRLYAHGNDYNYFDDLAVNSLDDANEELTIVSAADNGSGKTRITYTGPHTVVETDSITIYGTAELDGDFEVLDPIGGAGTFDVDITFATLGGDPVGAGGTPRAVLYRHSFAPYIRGIAVSGGGATPGTITVWTGGDVDNPAYIGTAFDALHDADETTFAETFGPGIVGSRFDTWQNIFADAQPTVHGVNLTTKGLFVPILGQLRANLIDYSGGTWPAVQRFVTTEGASFLTKNDGTNFDRTDFNVMEMQLEVI